MGASTCEGSGGASFGTLFGFKNGSVRRVADTTAELADGESGLESVNYKPKTATRQTSLMFHYPVFGGLKAIFAAAKIAICCTLTNCCTPRLAVKIVADCSQTVCNLLQSAENRRSCSERSVLDPMLTVADFTSSRHASKTVLAGRIC